MDLVDRLSPEGRAVYNLLNNRDPGKVAGLSSSCLPRFANISSFSPPVAGPKD